MKKARILSLFNEGLDYGVTYGCIPGLQEPYPTESLFEMFERLTVDVLEDKTLSVLHTVLIAGFNVGSNLRGEVLSEDQRTVMFENLIAGKPLEEGDAMYYAITDKIKKIIE
jgi:hypothetical protein